MPHLPSAIIGFDREFLPTGGGPASEEPVRRLSVARWLYTHTNLRIAGGYPSIQKSVARPPGLENGLPYAFALGADQRGWSAIFDDLWTHGWGVGIFAVILSRLSFYDHETGKIPDQFPRRGGHASRPVVRLTYGQTPGAWDGPDFDTADLLDERYADPGRTQPTVVLNAANGHLHGRFVKWVMSVRHPDLVHPVVYLDNEDGTGTFFSSDELAYYQALFEEMATARTGEPALRPGIYAHAESVKGDPDNSRSVVAQLAAVYPEVYICQVGYDNRHSLSALPVGGGRSPSSPAVNNFDARPDNAVWSVAVPAGAIVARRWTTWPTIKQWEGENTSHLPPGATASLRFRGTSRSFNFGSGGNGGWDFLSSIVPDPAYPAASPRLALTSRGPNAILATADRPDPPDDNTPATGRVTVYRIDAAGTVTQHASPLQPPQGYLILPGADLYWAGSYLVTLGRPTGSMTCVPLVWHQTASGMDAMGAVAASPGAPVHAPLVGAEGGSDIRLFYATADGRIHQTAGDPTRPGDFRTANQGGRLLHPFSRLDGAKRKDDVIDIVGIDDKGVLGTTWFTAAASSASSWTAIGAAGAFLPSTRLALVANGSDALLALGVGHDLQLTASHWTRTAGSWAAPYAIPTDPVVSLSPHTAIVAIRSAVDTVCVLATSDDDRLVVYRLLFARNWWSAPARPTRVGEPVASGPLTADTLYTRAPNPVGDLGLARAGATTVAASVWLEAGQSRAWLATRPDSAGVDCTNGWSAWTLLPPPR